ncbi:putative holin-like toxin, partial [Paenibacillus larvae]|uniref:putative holin-like toxin n=1 Tax=Paenibacillus larvae TaxID=1464 RepID=UPI002E0E1EE7
MWYNGTSNSGLRGRSASPRKGGDAMETFQALQLMFLFGMFILALLTFIQKMKYIANRPKVKCVVIV